VGDARKSKKWLIAAKEKRKKKIHHTIVDDVKP
jgi:hypothetical protein